MLQAGASCGDNVQIIGAIGTGIACGGQRSVNWGARKEHRARDKAQFNGAASSGILNRPCDAQARPKHPRLPRARLALTGIYRGGFRARGSLQVPIQNS